MTLLRFGLVVACCLGGFGCDVGGDAISLVAAVRGPTRASDIQNTHGISDDISATRMTDSDARKPHDPNASTTLPNHYQINSEQ